ncbi:hypothetical protein D3C81_1000080 [compost metagenome]
MNDNPAWGQGDERADNDILELKLVVGDSGNDPFHHCCFKRHHVLVINGKFTSARVHQMNYPDLSLLEMHKIFQQSDKFLILLIEQILIDHVFQSLPDLVHILLHSKSNESI